MQHWNNMSLYLQIAPETWDRAIDNQVKESMKSLNLICQLLGKSQQAVMIGILGREIEINEDLLKHPGISENEKVLGNLRQQFVLKLSRELMNDG